MRLLRATARGSFATVAFLSRAFASAATILLVLLLLILVLSPWLGRPSVPASGALVVRPVGALVEQVAEDPSDAVLRRAGLARGTEETLLRDTLEALDRARTDSRIKAVLLDLRVLAPSGFTKLRNLRDAILALRKSGKRVVAYSEGYEQTAYYLAAHADEVLLHEQGVFFIQGFGSFRPYYREGLDRLGVDVHVFRVGEYKSAVEPYLRSDMSPEAREATLDVLGDLWAAWTADVGAARKLEPSAIQAFVDGFPDRVKAAGGNLAQLARSSGFVDGLVPHDGLRRRMIELVGEDKAKKSFSQIGVDDYLRATGGRERPKSAPATVAVIVARGTILEGSQPLDAVGSESTGRLIRQARERDDVKAVVLRVDSPGGSAFASEVIRRECALTREAGKPVVVSMGSVAASGGYWIATASDEIWAEPQTITGSIGIFGMFATIDRPLARHLGIHVDGVGTTKMAGALRVDRPMAPEIAGAAQSVLDHGYESFLERVAEARKMSRDEVDRLARGRIWSGQDAAQSHLVDQLGGIDDAIRSASAKAKVEAAYHVEYLKPDSGFMSRLTGRFALALHASGGGVDAGGVLTFAQPAGALVPASLRQLEGTVLRDARMLLRWNDPSGLYAHCLCDEIE